MKNELSNILETKKGTRLNLEVVNVEAQNKVFVEQLALSYATDFWAGVWKELLVQRSSEGLVVAQYGTYDALGAVYDDTRVLAAINGVDITNSTWPRTLWELAGSGAVRDREGRVLEQFWKQESALSVLNEFIRPVSDNGYGGEILAVKDADNNIAAFTAYTVALFKEAVPLADKRFFYDRLLTVRNSRVEDISLGQLLNQEYSGAQKLGVFLDFAVSENMRGAGIGSALFDARISRMCELGADVIVGRTIQSSVAQYKGNYIARGMQPIAYDPGNTLKTICAVPVEKIIGRRG